MSENRRDPRQTAGAVLDYLRRVKNDRGAMAELRRALSPAQRHRAWPLLAPVGGIGNLRIEVIAGLFAYHPDETGSGNLGTTCRSLAEGNNSFEGRFARLLGCDYAEICERLRPVILTAKAKGIAVNYEQLFVDLLCWGDQVKTKWAQEFWGASGIQEPAEAAASEAGS